LAAAGVVGVLKKQKSSKGSLSAAAEGLTGARANRFKPGVNMLHDLNLVRPEPTGTGAAAAADPLIFALFTEHRAPGRSTVKTRRARRGSVIRKDAATEALLQAVEALAVASAGDKILGVKTEPIPSTACFLFPQDPVLEEEKIATAPVEEVNGVADDASSEGLTLNSDEDW
jgi:hypothetical protein